MAFSINILNIKQLVRSLRQLYFYSFSVVRSEPMTKLNPSEIIKKVITIRIKIVLPV